MNDNFYQQERMREQGFYTPTGIPLSRYTAKTFLTMFLGLLVTFAVSLFNYASGLFIVLFSIPGLHMILLLGELALVIGMSAAIHKISTGTATAFFYLYAVLNGIVFSLLFVVFELPNLVLVFGATALYFGGMAAFGYLTGLDLSRMRSVLFGGLIFLLIANLFLMFIPGLTSLDRVSCTVGMIIFLAFTAYDTQKIKALYAVYSSDPVMLQKASIISALELYLDFVNLFLYVLRLFGKRRN